MPGVALSLLLLLAFSASCRESCEQHSAVPRCRQGAVMLHPWLNSPWHLQVSVPCHMAPLYQAHQPPAAAAAAVTPATEAVAPNPGRHSQTSSRRQAQVSQPLRRRHQHPSSRCLRHPLALPHCSPLLTAWTA